MTEEQQHFRTTDSPKPILLVLWICMAVSQIKSQATNHQAEDWEEKTTNNKKEYRN